MIYGLMTRRPLRILHTSDVHLGPSANEPTGRAHAKECICPIHVIGHVVDEHAVDVVLIVGDLFDHARVSDQLVFDTFDALAKVNAEVVLLPGNHDAYDTTALSRRHRDPIDRARVRFFVQPDGTTIDLADGALRVWARAMEDHSPQNTPLAEAPAHPGDRWYIAAAHGHFVDNASEDHRSSRITGTAIDAVGADYVALGHWHLTTDLSTRGVRTPAWYCGAPLFGYGAGQMLLIDLVHGCEPDVRPVSVLDHPASRC